MKTLENLLPGETLLRSVSINKDGISFNAEICEMRKDVAPNLAALLNASDDRFKQSQPKAMHAWTRITFPEAKQYFGLEAEKLEFNETDTNGKKIAIVNIANPKVSGYRLVVQTEDSLVAVDGKKQYRVKKFGVNTDNVTIPTKGGLPIYSRRIVNVEASRSNIIIKRDGYMTEAEFEQFVATTSEVEESITE